MSGIWLEAGALQMQRAETERQVIENLLRTYIRTPQQNEHIETPPPRFATIGAEYYGMEALPSEARNTARCFACAARHDVRTNFSRGDGIKPCFSLCDTCYTS